MCGTILRKVPVLLFRCSAVVPSAVCSPQREPVDRLSSALTSQAAIGIAQGYAFAVSSWLLAW